MQSPVHSVTAIAYPLDSAMKAAFQGGGGSLDSSMASQDSNNEMGENFFSQLDSMIAAVKVESNALFSVKEKLQEMDSLRDQLVAVNKRMVEQEQTNLNLKQNLIANQQAISELRKQKTEADSVSVTLRQELSRAKEAFGKERSAKHQLQAEVQQLREQMIKMQQTNESLDRDAKALPGLLESNEIMKNDLNLLRTRYKEEKQHLQGQIKSFQGQLGDVENLRNEMRSMGMRLVDIATNSHNSAARFAQQAPPPMQQQGYGGGNSPNRYEYGQQQGMQQMTQQQGPGQGMINSKAFDNDSEEDTYSEEDNMFEDESVYSQQPAAHWEEESMSKVRQNLNRNVYGDQHTHAMASNSNGYAKQKEIKKPRKRRSARGVVTVGQSPYDPSNMNMSRMSSLPKI